MGICRAQLRRGEIILIAPLFGVFTNSIGCIENRVRSVIYWQDF